MRRIVMAAVGVAFLVGGCTGSKGVESEPSGQGLKATLPATRPATLPATVRHSVAVGLYHCGVNPLVIEGKTWEVPEPRFDATNKPATWIGRGTAIEVTPQNLKYTDESGAVLLFLPDDGISPHPCA